MNFKYTKSFLQKSNIVDLPQISVITSHLWRYRNKNTPNFKIDLFFPNQFTDYRLQFAQKSELASMEFKPVNSGHFVFYLIHHTTNFSFIVCHPFASWWFIIECTWITQGGKLIWCNWSGNDIMDSHQEIKNMSLIWVYRANTTKILMGTVLTSRCFSDIITQEKESPISSIYMAPSSILLGKLTDCTEGIYYTKICGAKRAYHQERFQAILTNSKIKQYLNILYFCFLFSLSYTWSISAVNHGL